MGEVGQGQPGRTRTAADGFGPSQHDDAPAGVCKRDGAAQPVRSGSDDGGVVRGARVHLLLLLARAGPASSAEKQRLFRELEEELRAHMQAEEDAFYSVLEQERGERDLVDQAAADHEQMKRHIRSAGPAARSR